MEFGHRTEMVHELLLVWAVRSLEMKRQKSLNLLKFLKWKLGFPISIHESLRQYWTQIPFLIHSVYWESGGEEVPRDSQCLKYE